MFQHQNTAPPSQGRTAEITGEGLRRQYDSQEPFLEGYIARKLGSESVADELAALEAQVERAGAERRQIVSNAQTE